MKYRGTDEMKEQHAERNGGCMLPDVRQHAEQTETNECGEKR